MGFVVASYGSNYSEVSRRGECYKTLNEMFNAVRAVRHRHNLTFALPRDLKFHGDEDSCRGL
jgi:hypothetical protein